MKSIFLKIVLCSIFLIGSNGYATVDNCEKIITHCTETDSYNSKAHNISFKKYKNLNAALKSAVKQDKMLMLMFSASWCAPCNYMKEYVFTNKQISEFYNANFVSVYLDADKDKAFIEQVRNEVGNVNALPSFLFFDKDKYFTFSFEGSQTTSDFLKKGHRAIEEQGYEVKKADSTNNNEVGWTRGDVKNEKEGVFDNLWSKVKGIFR